MELLDFFRITEEVVFHKVEIIVKLKHVGKSCGKVEADDVLVADALEVLDDTAKAVAVSYNEEVVHFFECGEDDSGPVGGVCDRCSLSKTRCGEVLRQPLQRSELRIWGCVPCRLQR